jgi:cyanophycinase
MEAIGSGLIILVDGTHMRHTNLTDVEMGEPVSIENLIVHVMAIGDTFDLRTKKLTIAPRRHPELVSGSVESQEIKKVD